MPQNEEEASMRWIARLVVGASVASCVVICMVPAHGQPSGQAAPVYGITIPEGYRDWRVVSVAQVGQPVNDIRIKLGNDAAIKAYRDGTLPFPDGAIIARLAYTQVGRQKTTGSSAPPPGSGACRLNRSRSSWPHRP